MGRGSGGRIPERFQTYRVLARGEDHTLTHHRRATCAEVDCPAWSRAQCEAAGCRRFHTGWRTILHAGSPLVEVARTSGRAYTEKPPDAAGLVEFTFGPGQQCFASPHWAPGVGACQVEHWVPLGRPPLYVVEGARTIRFGERGDLWAEHFAEHCQKLERLVT